MKKLGVLLLLLTSCETPQKGTVVDLLTPDSLGVGASEGTIDGFGLGNKTMRNQQEPLELDFEGESSSTSVWLEWDLPAFPDNEAMYKDRRRDRHMISINDKVTDLQDLAAYQMERDVEISDSHDVLVDAFLLNSDRKEQQLYTVSQKLDEVHATLEGLEGLILYNTERLGEVENLIPAAVEPVLEPEEVSVVMEPTTQEHEESLAAPITPENVFTPKINLEEATRPSWMWIVLLIGLFFNVYIIYRVFTQKAPEETIYIPASEVKSSLDWLRGDSPDKTV